MSNTVRCANKSCGLIHEDSARVESPGGNGMSYLLCPRCHHKSFAVAKPGEQEKTKSGAVAKKEGWGHVGGADYCPSCMESM